MSRDGVDEVHVWADLAVFIASSRPTRGQCHCPEVTKVTLEPQRNDSS